MRPSAHRSGIEKGHGSGWNALLVRDLIDELHLMVSPVALGAGVPLFTGPARLELREVRRFDDSSNVQLHYRTTSAGRPRA